jgi:hypothetical protein
MVHANPSPRVQYAYVYADPDAGIFDANSA